MKAVIVMSKNLLEMGEYEYGCYKVQHVEWLDGEWQGDGYWQRALVTNRRLIVSAEAADRPQNAQTIRSSDIRKVWNACLRGRDGILVVLKNGQHLYMLVDWSQGSKLVRDLKIMLQPLPTTRMTPRPVAS